ncbi:MAG: hypothetical protein WBD51_22540, partial [Burkholderiaceae bacterium]
MTDASFGQPPISRAALAASGYLTFDRQNEGFRDRTNFPTGVSLAPPQTVGLQELRWHLAQLSRHEHDRLRVELLRDTHHPVKVGTLESLGVGNDRLTAAERQLLREQLRTQRLAEEVMQATVVDTADPVSTGEDTTDRQVAPQVPTSHFQSEPIRSTQVQNTSGALPDAIR